MITMQLEVLFVLDELLELADLVIECLRTLLTIFHIFNKDY